MRRVRGGVSNPTTQAKSGPSGVFGQPNPPRPASRRVEDRLRPSMNPEALLAHGDFVRALARQLVRDPDRADDLAQQSWLNALSRKAPAVKSARAWLARIVRNASRDQHRSDERRERRELEAWRTGA